MIAVQSSRCPTDGIKAKDTHTRTHARTHTHKRKSQRTVNLSLKYEEILHFYVKRSNECELALEYYISTSDDGAISRKQINKCISKIMYDKIEQ
jgi:hypothetical protein